MQTAGIYIHIPFCISKCHYCDYYSTEKRDHEIPFFIEMLLREIELTAKDYNDTWQFDTIFIGGGTPSILEPSWLSDILDKLFQCFDLSDVREITLEANPDQISNSRLIAYHELGVNRLSLGFQTLTLACLKSLSRSHNPEDCINIFNNARNAGFDNISVDMLTNIPGQTLDHLKNDLETVTDLEPNHISIYPFIVEKNTPFFSKLEKGEITMSTEETAFNLFNLSKQFLCEKEFIQYEISHFAKPGMECLHNLHYWCLDPYLAFGPSAHGYNNKMRWWNYASLDTYFNKLSRYEKPIEGFEQLSSIDQFNEAVINGLRTNIGIPRTMITHVRDEYKKSLDSALKKWDDYLTISADSIHLKSDNFYLADEIALDMMIDK